MILFNITHVSDYFKLNMRDGASGAHVILGCAPVLAEQPLKAYIITLQGLSLSISCRTLSLPRQPFYIADRVLVLIGVVSDSHE
jgi:hypothetical protein